MEFISLKYKLLCSSIAISLILTVATSVLELNYDIDTHEASLQAELAHLEKTNRQYLAAMVWSMTYDSLEAFAANQVDGKWIDKITISDIRGDIIARAGGDLLTSSRGRKFDLTYSHNDRQNVIGSVYIGGNIPGFWETLKERWGVIFLVNGFFVATIFMFSYWLFYRNVLARLVAITAFTDSANLSARQIFKRYSPRKTKNPDEICLLIDSLNDRAGLIETEFSKRRAAESGLERKNAQLEKEIAGRRRIEKDLKEEEKRFRDISFSMADWIWEVDDAGKYTYVSDTVEKVLGYRVDEMIGKTPFDFMSGKDVALVRATLEKIVSRSSSIRDLENWCLAKDGASVCQLTNGVPILSSEDSLKGYRGVNKDITVQKKHAAEKKRIEAQLRQSQKLEALGTLAGGIAHDFNNILSPLMGFSEMLKEDVPQDSPQQVHIDEILKAAARLRDLVKQILAFSRKGDQDIKEILLQPVVQEALTLLTASIPATIEIRQEIDPQCGAVVADPTQVHQIVMNLATNAYHAMGKRGGKLTIALKEVRLDPVPAAFAPLSPGAYARLSVEDTGTGISREILDRVFDPYFTTKRKNKGTGLGLSIVQGIVRSCGGEIRIHSEPGKGTAVEVFLPVIAKRVEEKPPSRAALPAGRGERILLVDDEAAVLRMTQIMLERMGYRVTACPGSVEALAAFKADSEFQLIVSDMTMPEMTGLQLAGEIKKIKPEIRVVICTGFSDQLNAEKIKEAGIQGLVMKPVSRQELSEAVRMALPT